MQGNCGFNVTKHQNVPTLGMLQWGAPARKLGTVPVISAWTLSVVKLDEMLKIMNV